jgi:ribosome maturation factor RimP
MPSVVEQVRELVEPLLAARGLELEDIEHAGGSLRITVDREGGVDMQALSDATRIVSRALDEEDPLPGSYTLEVSSPGLERPLRTPEQFARAVGSAVKVKTYPEVEGDRRVEGNLVAADADGVTVGDRRLRYAEIERARTVFEWGPAPRPGKPTSTQKKAAPQ